MYSLFSNFLRTNRSSEQLLKFEKLLNYIYENLLKLELNSGIETVRQWLHRRISRLVDAVSRWQRL